MPRVQGYEITVKGFLPVDANDPENVAKAAKAIRDAKESGNFAGLQGIGLMKFDQKFTTKDSGAFRMPAAPVEGPVGEQAAGNAAGGETEEDSNLTDIDDVPGETETFDNPVEEPAEEEQPSGRRRR